MTSTTVPPRTPLGGVLTPRMESAIRAGSIGSAFVIALSAMVLSYAGLNDLARDAQINSHLALLVPIMVDGLQFVGSLGVVYSTLSGLRSAYPWMLMLMGVSVSAWGNWQAAPDDMTAKMLHAAAPVILALVLEELLRVMRHKVQLHAEAYEREQGALATTGDATEVAPEVLAVVTETRPVEAGQVLGRTEPARVAPAVPEAGLVVEMAPQPVEAARPVQASVVDLTSEATTFVDEPAAEPVAAPVAQAIIKPVDETGTEPVAERVAETVTEPEVLPQSPVVEPETVTEPEQPKTPESQDPEQVTLPPRATYDNNTLPPYPEDATFKEQMKAILLADPDTAPSKVARLMGKDPSWTRKNMKQARAELEAKGLLGASASADETGSEAPSVVAQPPAQPTTPDPSMIEQPVAPVAHIPGPRVAVSEAEEEMVDPFMALG